jgi:peptide/nickel transport system permease protein
MTRLVQFLISRLLFVVVTFVVVTAALYGIIMLAPVDARAELYVPPRSSPYLPPEVYERRLQQIIRDHHLEDPYPIQYYYWITGLLRGDWGWSTTLRVDVLEALLARLPATAELALISALLLVPTGLLTGVVAGWKHDRPPDTAFRSAAFVATSIPPFILGLVLLSVFYVGLGWFSPGRTEVIDAILVRSPNFQRITGLLTVDGLLNGRLDITLDALRHLVLPVITLAAAHWATLGRVTRAAMIEEVNKEYFVAAKARGLPTRRVVWRHALRNAIGPGLTSIAVSAAGLVTAVFVIEVLFDYPGLSALVARGWQGTPDTAVSLGFAVFSVLLVLPVMLVLDIVQTLADPRLRENVTL